MVTLYATIATVSLGCVLSEIILVPFAAGFVHVHNAAAGEAFPYFNPVVTVCVIATTGVWAACLVAGDTVD